MGHRDTVRRLIWQMYQWLRSLKLSRSIELSEEGEVTELGRNDKVIWMSGDSTISLCFVLPLQYPMVIFYDIS